jgi:hypothetical protein
MVRRKRQHFSRSFHRSLGDLPRPATDPFRFAIRFTIRSAPDRARVALPSGGWMIAQNGWKNGWIWNGQWGHRIAKTTQALRIAGLA